MKSELNVLLNYFCRLDKIMLIYKKYYELFLKPDYSNTIVKTFSFLKQKFGSYFINFLMEEKLLKSLKYT